MSGAWQISASTGTVLRLNKQLIGFFYKRVKETEDAKELASTTWMHAGRTFEHRSSLRHFLFAVAYGVLGEHRRRGSRRISAESADFEDAPDPRMSLESLMFHVERKASLTSAIAQLPEPYRDVVRLAVLGHKNHEIANELRLNYNTVRSRLSRGTALLRELLEINK
jgi:RNA polymerase sigma-70 factor (ECF subfamily)